MHNCRGRPSVLQLALPRLQLARTDSYVGRDRRGLGMQLEREDGGRSQAT